MTDLEMVKRCAVAMGRQTQESVWDSRDHTPKPVILAWFEEYPYKGWLHYDPLHDDAQAMALVKRFNADIQSPVRVGGTWAVTVSAREQRNTLTGWTVLADAEDPDLNRAICTAVAQLQPAHPSPTPAGEVTGR